MTTPDFDSYEALDRRIRAASDLPFDDIAVTEAVLARVHKTRLPKIPGSQPAPRRIGWTALAGPAAFASVLLATPFVVALYPASEDALLIGLATGDPRAIFAEAGMGPFGALDGAVE